MLYISKIVIANGALNPSWRWTRYISDLLLGEVELSARNYVVFVTQLNLLQFVTQHNLSGKYSKIMACKANQRFVTLLHFCHTIKQQKYHNLT